VEKRVFTSESIYPVVLPRRNIFQVRVSTRICTTSAGGGRDFSPQGGRPSFVSGGPGTGARMDRFAQIGEIRLPRDRKAIFVRGSGGGGAGRAARGRWKV